MSYREMGGLVVDETNTVLARPPASIPDMLLHIHNNYEQYPEFRNIPQQNFRDILDGGIVYEPDIGDIEVEFDDFIYGKYNALDEFPSWEEIGEDKQREFLVDLKENLLSDAFDNYYETVRNTIDVFTENCIDY